MSGEPLALYVHWPFCVSKCPYCDFNSHVRAEIDQDAWREHCSPTSRMRRGCCPAEADLDLLRRRHALADGSAHRRSRDRLPRSGTGRPPPTSRSRWRRIPIRSKPRASPTWPRPASIACRSGCRALTIRPSPSSAVRIPRARVFPRWKSRSGNSAVSASTSSTRCLATRRSSWSATLGQALSLGTRHLSLYQLTIEPGPASPRSMQPASLPARFRRVRRAL